MIELSGSNLTTVVVVAVIARYLWKLVNLLRGRDPGAETDITKTGSAL